MRILFIVTSFFSKNLRGGTEKYLFNLISKLKSQHQISLLIPNNYAVSLKGVKVFTYFKPEFQIIGKLVKGISILLTFLRIILFNKPNVISNFLPNPAMAFLFPIAKILGIKTIQNFRGYMKESKISQLVIDLSLALSYYFTDYITTNGRSGLDQYRSSLLFGNSQFDSIKKYIIPNAVDAHFWSNEEKHENQMYDIAFNGNIYDKPRIILKGFPNLYYAIKSIANEYNVNLKVVVIGDYSIKEIENIIKGFECSSFDFKGLIKEREKIKDLLQQAKIFVLSSLSEGMSNALMEAMCLGIPSISTDVGGVSELIRDGWNGFVVPPNDAKILGRKIWFLIQDQSLQQKFSKNSHQWLKENFSWKQHIKKINYFYKLAWKS